MAGCEPRRARALPLLLLPLLLALCSLSAAQPRQRQGYLIAAPSVFRSGVEEAISVTIFNSVKETTVQIQLVVKGETVSRSHGTVLGELLDNP